MLNFLLISNLLIFKIQFIRQYSLDCMFIISFFQFYLNFTKYIFSFILLIWL